MISVATSVVTLLGLASDRTKVTLGPWRLHGPWWVRHWRWSNDRPWQHQRFDAVFAPSPQTVAPPVPDEGETP